MREFVTVPIAAMRRVVSIPPVLACIVLVAVYGSQAAASDPRPPTAFTGVVGQLTTSSVTLKGSVDPSNQQTSYCFQYGPTSAYGAQTPLTPIGGGTHTIHVSMAVTGLSAGSPYHYRLVAVNPSGTVDGLDQTFTTRKVPLTFTVAASPSPDVFGTTIFVVGRLSGTESANHAIVLQANSFPYLGGFTAVGDPEVTDADGNFSFAVARLSRTARLRVVTLGVPAVNSKVVLERVAVRVTLHVRPAGRRGFARLYGTVAPTAVGATVRLQLLRPGRKPLNVAATVLGRRTSTISRFSRVVRIRRAGLYRAFVRVAGGPQVSGHSRVILVR